MYTGKERGFTLPELLVVILVFVLLLAGSVFFLRPKSYATIDTQAGRRLGLSVLAQSLKEYKARNGTWPPAIPAKDTVITSQSGGYDLCPQLVPGYLQDLPLDPQVGIAYTGDDSAPNLTTKGCGTKGVKYLTGYSIRLSPDKAITLTAPQVAGVPLVLTVR
jgi:prepilin-type N-terminal cleavage/methylation domain-containing protein